MLEKKKDAITTPTEISVAAKERLAKLLATENLTVEHRNVPTAAFDIKNRVLVLPNWKDITKDIYDLLVLHEVGHALWTPFEGWHGAVSVKGDNYKGFLNVTEDARIEKKQKRKFPGGRRAMIEGYKELLARDFFGIKDRDIATFGLIDRLNIHFKIGQSGNVPFSDEEMGWVDRMAALETFEDAEALADDLFAFEKENAPETDTGRGAGGDAGDDDEYGEDTEDGDSSLEDGEEPCPFGDDDAEGESDTDGDAPTGSGEGMEDGDESDSDDDSDGAGNDDGEDTSTGDTTDDDGMEAEGDIGDQYGGGQEASSEENTSDDDPVSETDAAFREKENTMVDRDPTGQARYVQIPVDSAVLLDSIIVPNKRVVSDLHVETHKERLALEVKNYRAANAKAVNYLAKEFEMRKAADASKRTSIAKTGTLNMNTLHSYKWNDDIFKKIANVADGKSHGLQMFLDWSGSMHNNMQGSIEQVMNLVLFCKKVGIPFDVYAFTNSWSDSERDYYADALPRYDESKLESGDILIEKHSHFNLLQIATSQGNRSDFTNMLQGLALLRSGHTQGEYWYETPRAYCLGGTPLHEAIMTSIPIINRFREANRLQQVTSVFLTDGDGSCLDNVHGTPIDNGSSVIIRDRKTRKELSDPSWGNYGYYADPSRCQMSVLLEMVRIRTQAKIVNFFVADDKASRFKSEWKGVNSGNKNYEFENWNKMDTLATEATKTAKAEGGLLIEGSISGWDHHYMIMGGKSMHTNGDDQKLDVATGAKKGAIKRAFGKMSGGKLRNRLILRKFMELITD